MTEGTTYALLTSMHLFFSFLITKVYLTVLCAEYIGRFHYVYFLIGKGIVLSLSILLQYMWHGGGFASEILVSVFVSEELLTELKDKNQWTKCFKKLYQRLIIQRIEQKISLV